MGLGLQRDPGTYASNTSNTMLRAPKPYRARSPRPAAARLTVGGAGTMQPLRPGTLHIGTWSTYLHTPFVDFARPGTITEDVFGYRESRGQFRPCHRGEMERTFGEARHDDVASCTVFVVLVGRVFGLYGGAARGVFRPRILTGPSARRSPRRGGEARTWSRPGRLRPARRRDGGEPGLSGAACASVGPGGVDRAESWAARGPGGTDSWFPRRRPSGGRRQGEGFGGRQVRGRAASW